MRYGTLFPLVGILLSGTGCMCRCDCEHKPGEKHLRAFTAKGDSLLEEVSFTYQRHVDWERTHDDAIQEFLQAHQNDSISEILSHTTEDKDYDLTCRKGEQRKADMWECQCYK